MQSFDSDSAAVLAAVWAAYVMVECTVLAEGSNSTEFLFNGEPANYLFM